MEKRTIDILNDATRRFYETFAASFSSTRDGAWRGWAPIADRLRSIASSQGGKARILDIGCGNMRFEDYLGREASGVDFEFVCVDACAEMMGERERCTLVRCDVVGALSADVPIPGMEGPFDAGAAFGLFHHIPGGSNRAELLRRMVGAVRPGGIVAVSFWKFLEDGRLARKADAVTPAGLIELGLSEDDLEPGDRFLGWQNEKGALRYCHSFDDAEVDALVSEVHADIRAVRRFTADRSNEYVILEK